MKTRLNGKRALVTGGARGIGRSICEALLAEGADVILTDIDKIEGSKTANDLGIEFVYLDVANRQDFEELIKGLTDNNTNIDILVNNAGIMRVGSFSQLSEKDEQTMVNVNLYGVINGIHAVLPEMKNRNEGCIVNIGSLAGQVSMPYGALYSCTKFGVTAIGDALNLELNKSKIHVCTVFPGMVHTELIAGISPPRFPKKIYPKDVANAVIKGIVKRKKKIYVPSSGIFFGKLPMLLPQFLINPLAAISGANKIFKSVNNDDRHDYRNRIKISSN